MDSSILPLILIGAAISALTEGLKAAIPETVKPRLMPLVPLLLGALAGLLAPSLVPGADLPAKVVWGILAGAFSGQLYELFSKQFQGASTPKKDDTP
jgi:hypothetical protein